MCALFIKKSDLFFCKQKTLIGFAKYMDCKMHNKMWNETSKFNFGQFGQFWEKYNFQSNCRFFIAKAEICF